MKYKLEFKFSRYQIRVGTNLILLECYKRKMYEGIQNKYTGNKYTGCHIDSILFILLNKTKCQDSKRLNKFQYPTTRNNTRYFIKSLPLLEKNHKLTMFNLSIPVSRRADSQNHFSDPVSRNMSEYDQIRYIKFHCSF